MVRYDFSIMNIGSWTYEYRFITGRGVTEHKYEFRYTPSSYEPIFYNLTSIYSVSLNEYLYSAR